MTIVEFKATKIDNQKRTLAIAGYPPHIYSIEVSGVCNLKCSYCPHPKLKRKKGFMDQATFEKALSWAKLLEQKWIALHNFGEPLLHKDIIHYVRIAASVIEHPIISTNGLLLTNTIIDQLAEAGLYKLHVSLHKKTKSISQAIDYAKTIGILGEVRDMDTQSHDWAGQINNDKWQFHKYEICQFISYNYMTVLWDGRIANCCIDADEDHILGNIHQDNLYDLHSKPIPLCQQCHLTPFVEELHQIPKYSNLSLQNFPPDPIRYLYESNII